MPKKFTDPHQTLKGEPRAYLDPTGLHTLWINTGTLCNLECKNCYIESSPKNDRLSYIRTSEVVTYLDEIETDSLGTEEIGFTGGEPFMNPDFIDILEKTLQRGFRVLILTNAMKPMMQKREALLKLKNEFGSRLSLRVSLDHYTEEHHALERGPRSWKQTLEGLQWLADQGFDLSVAGRSLWDEKETDRRQGYKNLLDSLGVSLDVSNPERLVVFPEMDEKAEVPEITTSCWDILKVQPSAMMCASSRMVVKRKGSEKPDRGRLHPSALSARI